MKARRLAVVMIGDGGNNALTLVETGLDITIAAGTKVAIWAAKMVLMHTQ